MKFSILGGSGFVGGALVKKMRAMGHEVFSPNRDELADCLRNSQWNWGHLIYCIGLTSDFRVRPFDTVTSHVTLLNDILRKDVFESITYLSSTRVYSDLFGGEEDSQLNIHPQDGGSIYNLSKLMGESLCLNATERGRVVRLSNVYGWSPNSSDFLSSVISDCCKYGKVRLLTGPASEKDYVSLLDVLDWLPEISLRGRFGEIYNLASGENTSNDQIASCLTIKGCDAYFDPSASIFKFPTINVSKVSAEFWRPRHRLVDDFSLLYDSYFQGVNLL